MMNLITQQTDRERETGGGRAERRGEEGEWRTRAAEAEAAVEAAAHVSVTERQAGSESEGRCQRPPVTCSCCRAG
jgi:hypothetical protein